MIVCLRDFPQPSFQLGDKLSVDCDFPPADKPLLVDFFVSPFNVPPFLELGRVDPKLVLKEAFAV